MSENGKVPTDQLPSMAVDAYTKTQSLLGTTAAQFGLDENAVPDDVLSWLGKYNEHWWSALHGEASSYTKYSALKTDLTANKTIYNSGTVNENYNVTISVSREISCDGSGVSLQSPTTYTFKNSVNDNSQSRADTILNFFTTFGAPFYVNVDTTSDIYYIPNDATFDSDEALSTLSVYISSSSKIKLRITLCVDDDDHPVAQSVTLTSEIVTVPAGETTYEHSTDRNAYPDSGTQDGITYTYLGVPFEKFPTMPQIETGSYTGTGKVGASNPVKLTFNFAPNFLFVRRLFTSDQATKQLGQELLVWVVGLQSVPLFLGSSAGSSNANVVMTATGTEVSWYNPTSPGTAQFQLNISGETYYYIALG